MLTKKPILIGIFSAAFAGLLVFGSLRIHAPNHAVPSHESIHRIVSLAPSITETLYALGVGEKIAGVTRFCDYPADAATKATVGGFIDVNYEALVALQPDIVILLEEHEAVQSYLNNIQIPFVTVNHKTIQGVMASFDSLGIIFHKQQKAQAILDSMQSTIAFIRKNTRRLPAPEVLITLERAQGSLQQITIVGDDHYYDEMLDIIGAVNVYNGISIRYPTISLEGIQRLNPDVIIEIISNPALDSNDIATYAEDWNRISDLTAVKNNNVRTLHQPYTARPGPRIVLFLQDLLEAVHSTAL